MNNNLCNNVKRLRECKGLSNADLSVIIGVEEEKLNGIEQGMIQPDLTILNPIAQFYGINPVDLYSSTINIDNQNNRFKMGDNTGSINTYNTVSTDQNVNMQTFTPINETSQVKPASRKLGINILTLCMSCIMMLLFFVLEVFYFSELIPDFATGSSYDLSFWMTMSELTFESDVFIDVVCGIIIVASYLLMITYSLMYLGKVKFKYGRIMAVIASVLCTFITVYIIVSSDALIDNFGLRYIVPSILLLILQIINFVKTRNEEA